MPQPEQVSQHVTPPRNCSYDTALSCASWSTLWDPQSLRSTSTAAMFILMSFLRSCVTYCKAGTQGSDTHSPPRGSPEELSSPLSAPQALFQGAGWEGSTGSAVLSWHHLASLRCFPVFTMLLCSFP